MKTVEGKVAAITGAGSGIGRATAALLAKHGCALALSDVNEAGLAETAKLCGGGGKVKVTTTRVDVSRREQVEAWAKQVVADHGKVNIIINNAGVALAATVEDTRYEDFEWLMGINFWGVVHGTKAFLPLLREAGEGHIVNVSSVFGLIGVPTQAAYNAAKFAVKGFTEALRQELETEGAPIGVSVIHPGGIKTNIARNARQTIRAGWVEESSGKSFEKLFGTSAERAAEHLYSAILHNHRRVLIGRDALAIDWMQRVLPALYQRVMIRGLKKRRAKLLRRANAPRP